MNNIFFGYCTIIMLCNVIVISDIIFVCVERMCIQIFCVTWYLVEFEDRDSVVLCERSNLEGVFLKRRFILSKL